MSIERPTLLRTSPTPRGDRLERDSSARVPVPLSPFIGREREAAAAISMLRSRRHRLITLIGPGGVGKTRLALLIASEVGASFPDGADFVDLAFLREPDLVPAVIAQALDIRRADDQPTLATLKNVLRHREQLLVLDNFEHLVDAAPVISSMLQACPGVTALVTSRAALQLSGERTVPVPPLGLPAKPRSDTSPDLAELAMVESVKLFIDRSRAVQTDFDLTEQNARFVAEICSRLDGLPLAIELAAARGSLFSPEDMLAMMEQRLPLLTTGARDLPGRQQTMRDAIAWSYDLLKPAEQVVFRRLAVFVGGCTLRAAESICRSQPMSESDATEDPAGRTEPDMIEILESLIRQSMIQTTRGHESSREPTEVRLHMLETVREFAAAELAASGDEETARRHARFFLELIRQAESTFWGDEPGDGQPLVDAELANLRAALVWSLEHQETDTALQLASALFDPYWLFDFHWLASDSARRQREWLQQALALPEGSANHRARALATAACLAEAHGDVDEAKALLDEAMQLAVDSGDELGWATAAFFRGRVEYRQDRLDTARDWLTKAFHGFRENHAQGRAAWALCFLASLDSRIAIDEGADPAVLRLAAERCEEAVATFRAADYRAGIMRALHGLAYVAYKQRDFPRSLELTKELVGLARAHNRPVYDYLDDIADIAGRIGHPAISARLHGAAMADRRRHGSELPPVFQAEFEQDLSVARQALGDGAFEAAWNEGEAMPIDRAIDEALAFIATGLEPQIALTPREMEVLPLLADGMTAREIAATLFLSHRTVENHIASLRAKLNVRSRTDVVEAARALGLLSIPDGPENGTTQARTE